MISRRLVVGGTGAAVLAALGYRAWDRGMFSAGTGAAFEPWRDWKGLAGDGPKRPLRAGILAANPHDTQPWLFAAAGDTITILADRARNLGSFDPYRREMHLGLGCATENIVLAAGAFGLDAAVEPVSGNLTLSPPDTPFAAARVQLTQAAAAQSALFRAIPNRHTNRGAYLPDKRINAATLRKFEGLTASKNVRVVFLTDGSARRDMGMLVVNATEKIIADPEMSADSARWFRIGKTEIEAHRDGVTMDNAGLSPLVLVAAKMLPDVDTKTADESWLAMTRDTQVSSAPVLGVILVRDRFDMAQAIEAGRAWQRLHLAATAAGLAAQPVNQPVEMADRNKMLAKPDEFARALAKFAGEPGWDATFTFRMGYADRPAGPSPRRPLSGVLRA